MIYLPPTPSLGSLVDTAAKNRRIEDTFFSLVEDSEIPNMAMATWKMRRVSLRHVVHDFAETHHHQTIDFLSEETKCET